MDPIEDVRVLVLLYKLGANKKPAEIQKEEWIQGCHTLSLDSIDKFKKFIPQLDTGFMDREEFGDFYKVRTELFFILCTSSVVVTNIFDSFYFVVVYKPASHTQLLTHEQYL